MGVSDDKVNEIIQEAMGKGGAGNGGCCGQVEAAFRYLQRLRREPGKSLDLDLAAAEHYLFARYSVCSGWVSPQQMMALVVAYDLKKLLDKEVFKDPNKSATTSNPVSPPNAAVVLWGLRGVTVGQGQHDLCNGDVKPPLWRPIKEVLGTSVSY